MTKALFAYAALVAVEEGSISLDEPAGPPGSTVRHLLAHASGLPFEGHDPIARPGQRRVYSNTGFEVLAEHLERATALRADRYVREAVTEPLGMTATELTGSVAADARSSAGDLARFAAELLAPTLVTVDSLAAATTNQIATLAGIVPGVGRFDDNAWGLGFELHGAKDPHWMPAAASPQTFGHFGATGCFVWIDPNARVAAVTVTSGPFGDWALAAWPAWGDEILREHARLS